MVKLRLASPAVLMAILVAGRTGGNTIGSMGPSRYDAGAGNRGSSSPPGSPADRS